MLSCKSYFHLTQTPVETRFYFSAWQPVGLKTHNADFREKDTLALKVNMLIRNNLQFIKGLSPTNCQAAAEA
jgi:hypothetical protein